MSTEPTNGLTPAEAERLYILMEECAEVTKECAKILRFGYAPAAGYDNRATLTTEMGDLMAALELVTHADLVEEEVIDAAEAKHKKLKRYTKHQ